MHRLLISNWSRRSVWLWSCLIAIDSTSRFQNGSLYWNRDTSWDHSCRHLHSKKCQANKNFRHQNIRQRRLPHRHSLELFLTKHEQHWGHRLCAPRLKWLRSWTAIDIRFYHDESISTVRWRPAYNHSTITRVRHSSRVVQVLPEQWSLILPLWQSDLLNPCRWRLTDHTAAAGRPNWDSNRLRVRFQNRQPGQLAVNKAFNAFLRQHKRLKSKPNCRTDIWRIVDWRLRDESNFTIGFRLRWSRHWH